MKTTPETVFAVWCRLTGQDLNHVDDADRAEFFASPHILELASAPYGHLLDAGISAARRGSLPLERWIVYVRGFPRGPGCGD
jgi:hypothetical protein